MAQVSPPRSIVGVASYEEEQADVHFFRAALCSRRVGESAIEAATRRIITGAFIFAGGRQDHAAALLGISKRVMNYHCANHRLRPKDRKAVA